MTPLAIGIGVGLSFAPIQGGGASDPFASALYDLDYKNGVYKGALLTDMLTEAANFVGGLYEMEADGSLVSVGANAIQRSPDGLEVWPSRTNRVLQCRNLTDALWTKTGVTPTRSTGRNGGANQGSRLTLDATGSGTATQAAVTLASNLNIMSIDVKRVTGTPTLEMTQDGGTTWVSVGALTTAWQRLSIPAQTLVNPQFGLRMTGTAGDVLDIDYVQSEVGNDVSPRIVTTTANVQRPQNRATCLGEPPLRDLIKTDTYTAFWHGKMSSLGGKGVYISDANFNISIGADGSCALLNAPAGSFLFDVYQKIAFSRASNGVSKASFNGGPIFTSSIGSHAAITHFDVSTNGAGAFNIRGKVRRSTFWSAPIAETSLQAIST